MSIMEHETAPLSRFGNFGDVLRALDDISADRILIRPVPGTASEANVIERVERKAGLCELVDGTLVEKPVGYKEALLAQMIAHFLFVWVMPRKLGKLSGPDTMARMTGGNVLLPDVAFYVRGRVPRDVVVAPGAPDLAVEVLSPSNTNREMARKRREYFASGTRLLWEFDPDTRQVNVYVSADAEPKILNQDDTLDGGEVLPGFSVPVREIFAVLEE